MTRASSSWPATDEVRHEVDRHPQEERRARPAASAGDGDADRAPDVGRDEAVGTRRAIATASARRPSEQRPDGPRVDHGYRDQPQAQQGISPARAGAAGRCAVSGPARPVPRQPEELARGWTAARWRARRTRVVKARRTAPAQSAWRALALASRIHARRSCASRAHSAPAPPRCPRRRSAADGDADGHLGQLRRTGSLPRHSSRRQDERPLASASIVASVSVAGSSRRGISSRMIGWTSRPRSSIGSETIPASRSPARTASTTSEGSGRRRARARRCLRELATVDARVVARGAPGAEVAVPRAARARRPPTRAPPRPVKRALGGQVCRSPVGDQPAPTLEEAHAELSLQPADIGDRRLCHVQLGGRGRAGRR